MGFYPKLQSLSKTKSPYSKDMPLPPSQHKKKHRQEAAPLSFTLTQEKQVDIVDGNVDVPEETTRSPVMGKRK